MKRVRNSLFLMFLSLVLASLFVIAGCGDDGAQGPPGPPGPSGGSAVGISTLNAADMAALAMTGEVTGVTIASPPVVTFMVKDQFGRGVAGLGVKSTSNTDNLRFGLAKLVPGTAGNPDKWIAYTGLTSATSRPSTERDGTIVDHGDGSYTYTFTTNVSTSPANAWETVYEPGLTHRLAVQISGTIAASGLSIANPTDIIHDFVPAGGTVTSKREIVTTAACNSCHGKIGTTTPHGGRVDTRYCVVCHTDQRRIGRTVSSPTSTGLLSGSTYVVNDEAQGNFPVMIHKIHKGEKLALQGYNYGGVLFNEVGYPQDILNCRKCHQQSADAPQGDNWKDKPSRRACGACHDNIAFVTNPTPTGFTLHSGNEQADDTACSGCHTADDIEGYHVTTVATSNNPNVPTGVAKFEYVISSVTVTNTSQPQITFSILKDGVPAIIEAYSAATNTTTLISGFTGGPRFDIAFARPQDGITAPVDFNLNITGTSPSNVSLLTVWSGANGTLTDNSNGTYTAIITSTTGSFPADAVMRTVVMDGSFTQVSPAGTRYARPVAKTVTGDTARRDVVSTAKCDSCHEWLGLDPSIHGGSRANVQYCVTCHNSVRNGKNGSSSDLTTRTTSWSASLNNITHSIHAADFRNNAFTWHDDQDYELVVYPGILNNCEACHNAGTYDYSASMYSNLWGKFVLNTTTTGTLFGDANDYGTNGAATNLVTTTITEKCFACHDSTTDKAHMTLNGGGINVARSVAYNYVETCLLCHGSGKVSDIKTKHGM